ncbi:MAG: histidine kinase [Planctomycetota bacterium]|jgi:signal transduction histidine kinase
MSDESEARSPRYGTGEEVRVGDLVGFVDPDRRVFVDGGRESRGDHRLWCEDEWRVAVVDVRQDHYAGNVVVGRGVGGDPYVAVACLRLVRRAGEVEPPDDVAPIVGSHEAIASNSERLTRWAATNPNDAAARIRAVPASVLEAARLVLDGEPTSTEVGGNRMRLELAALVAAVLVGQSLILWRVGVARARADRARIRLLADALAGRDLPRTIHDALSPLAAVVAGMEYVLENQFTLSEEDLERTVRDALEATERTVRMLRGLVERSEPREIHLAQAVHGAIVGHGADCPFRVAVSGGRLVRARPDSIDRLLGNLISNAARHRVPGTVVDVLPLRTGIAIVNEVPGRVDPVRIANSTARTGMSNVRHLAESLGVAVAFDCVRVRKAWVLRVEVRWP